MVNITQKSRINTAILTAALEVHKQLGPGLSRDVYIECFCHELRLQGILFRKNLDIPLHYKEMRMQEGFRVDLLVEGDFIVKILHVDEIFPLHTEQVRTLLKLTGKHSGVLINFNVVKLIDGYRKVNYINTAL